LWLITGYRMIPKEGVQIALGWVDPTTKKTIPYKVLIPRYIVDTEFPFPTTKISVVMASRGDVLPDEVVKFIKRYMKFRMIPFEEKVRFFIYSDPELSDIKRLLDEDKITYEVSVIELTPEQEAIVKECEEKEAPLSEVLKKLL